MSIRTLGIIAAGLINLEDSHAFAEGKEMLERRARKNDSIP